LQGKDMTATRWLLHCELQHAAHLVDAHADWAFHDVQDLRKGAVVRRRDHALAKPDVRDPLTLHVANTHNELSERRLG